MSARKTEASMIRNCPSCTERNTLERATAPLTRRVDGLEFTITVPALRCRSCGEEVTSHLDGERFEIAIASELAALGRRTGTALRFMRKALGYRAADLAALLDVTPETLSRWETGEREPDGRTFALVGLLADARLRGADAAVVSLLQAIREPKPIGKKPIQVRLAGS